MASSFELNAQRRETKGKGASRRLRRLQNRVPAIMYGGGEEAMMLSFDHNQLKKAMESEAFYSHILTIHIDGQKQQAVLKDVQRHPYRPRIQHLDFLRITGKEKIQMQVPLHFINGDIAPGVKVGGGLVSHLMNSVEVKCLPANLPEYIEVDLANLELDASIHLSELKVSPGVELVALAHGSDLPVASIHIPRAAFEEEAPAAVTPEAEAAAAATPATAEGAAAAKPAAAPAEKGKEKG